MKYMMALGILFAGVFSHAEETYDLTGRWGAGLGVGMTSVLGSDAFTEGNSELDSTFAASLWLRYHFSKRLGVEFTYSRFSFAFADKAPPMVDMDPSATMLDVSLAYRAFPTKVYHILMQVGLGYVRFSDFDINNLRDKRDDLALKGRVGFEYMLTPHMMAAIQADYYKLNYGSSTPDDLQVIAPMLGLTYYFNNHKKVIAPVAPVVVDADGDGVADADDKCPGTPAGQAVNGFGCAQTEKLEITLNVQFAPGKAEVDPKFTADLEKFAEFLTKYPETKAEIEGHTDNTGAEKLNFRISQKRAESVRKYLINNLKVDQTRVTPKGYGPSQPVADNTTPEGREKNRRVVAHVKTDK